MQASRALNWIGWSTPLLALSALLTFPAEGFAQKRGGSAQTPC